MTRPLDSLFRSAVLKEKAYSVTEHVCPVKLNQNENPFPFPADLKKEIEADLLAAAWNRYPTVFPDHLIEKLTRILGLDSGSVLMGHGSNELIYSSLWAILDRGDEVLIPEPAFSLYKTVAGFCEARVISGKSNPETLAVDMEFLKETIRTRQPKLVILPSPNNPSGQRIPYQDLVELIRSSTGLVWVDEAYIEFSENPSLVDCLAEFDNLILLRTFSKAFGLAGLRLGYLASSPEIIRQLQKTKVPFTVDEMSQIIASKLLDHPEVIAATTRRLMMEKQRVFGELKQLPGLFIFDSDTNFFIFKGLSKPHSDLFNGLISKGILVRDVSSYPLMAGCLRVTIGTEEENDQFLSALRHELI